MKLSEEKLEELMRASIELSKESLRLGNSPFGCVIADINGNILAEGQNTTKTDANPLAHAEINAILNLTKLRKNEFNTVVLVCSVQSCPMCFSAAYRSGIRTFVYGCAENDTLVPKIDVLELNKLCSPKAEIITGVLENECKVALKEARDSS